MPIDRSGYYCVEEGCPHPGTHARALGVISITIPDPPADMGNLVVEVVCSEHADDSCVSLHSSGGGG